MNPISNIWNHPRTSAAGVLIAIITVAGVLSQQGVTLGNAGTGTLVTLLSAIATALLGLLARDPSAAPQKLSATPPGIDKGSGQKLAAWLLVALLLPLPWIEGCSGV